MRALDTGLLAVAINRWAPDHARAARLVEELVNGEEPWALPCTVAEEFLALVTHPHRVVRPLGLEEARGVLEALQSSPSAVLLLPTRRHIAALAEVAAMVPADSGPPPRLATAALLREHGVRELLGPDAAMRRYPFLSVVDPLRAEGAPPRRRYRMLRSPGSGTKRR